MPDRNKKKEFHGSISQLFNLLLTINLDDGWFISSVPIITANWEASSEDEWTIPLGLGVEKAIKFGKISGTAQIHAYCNVKKPDNYGEV